MSKAIGDFPTIPPQNLDCRNNADAIADVPRILSANCVMNAVHATGSSAISATQTAPHSMISPSGNYGHDHSGGVWGRPFVRSIATMNLGASEFYSSNFIGGHEVFRAHFTDVPSDTSDTSSAGEGYIYVPPCDELKGAYNVLDLFLVVSLRDHNDVFAADSIELMVTNKTTGDSVSFSESGVSTNPTNVIFISDADSERLNFQQGQFNRISFQFTWNSDISGGLDRSISARVLEFSCGVMQN